MGTTSPPKFNQRDNDGLGGQLTFAVAIKLNHTLEYPGFCFPPKCTTVNNFKKQQKGIQISKLASFPVHNIVFVPFIWMEATSSSSSSEATFNLSIRNEYNITKIKQST